MSVVLDFFAQHERDFYRCAKQWGADGIARYLVLSPDADPRACSTVEVSNAHSAGLSVHFFYEMSPTYPGYFTPETGQRDARAALVHLRALGAPHGTVVYFTVDAPASVVSPPVLVPYFNAIEDVLRNEDDGLLVPGIYGFQAHVEYVAANFPNVGRHLAQTYGVVTTTLDLWQHLQTEVCGVEVDVNECSVPGWAPEGGRVDPEYIGQSAESISAKPGVITLDGGVWQWADGRKRQIPFKTIASKPGRYVVTQYPPADPDADPTLVLSAQPALFIITVSGLAG